MTSRVPLGRGGRSGTTLIVFAMAASIPALVLVGCTTAEPPVVEPSSGSVEAHPPGEDWDLTSEQLIEAWEASKAGLAEQYRIMSPPDVELVRFVSLDEWATDQVNCIRALGVGVEIGSQGGIEFDDVPPDQGPTVNLAAYTCALQYPVDPRAQMMLPRLRAEMQYQHLVDVVTPCVEDLGFPVSAPPTLETWLEQYYAGGEVWDPYADVAAQMSPGDSALDDAYEFCPHDAPELYPPVDS